LKLGVLGTDFGEIGVPDRQRMDKQFFYLLREDTALKKGDRFGGVDVG
jgi:hypothetical protein